MAKAKKSKQLTISRRDAKLSPNMTFRTQIHGDEPVTAGDLGISEVMLDREEFNAIMRDKTAYSRHFAQRPGSTLYDPTDPHLAPLRFAEKIENAEVTIYLGADGREVRLGVCKLKRPELDRKSGGMTALSFLLQATPTLDKRIGELLDSLSHGIQIEIRYEHNAEQPELNMAAGEEKPKDDEGAQFERDAKAQVDAFKRGRRSGKDERPDAH